MKKNLDDIAPLVDALKNIQGKLGKEGRAFVRYSGTEALARVTVEGKSQQEIEAMGEELASIIRKELG